MTRMHCGGAADYVDLLRADERHVAEPDRAGARSAGNIEWMSSVAVKMMLMTSSWSTSLRSKSSPQQRDARARVMCVGRRRDRPWWRRGGPDCWGHRRSNASWRSASATARSSARTSSVASGAPLPGRQRRSVIGPDPGPHQPHDRMADRLAHPPHLPVAALVDGEAHHVRASSETDLRRRGHAVVELDALAEPAQRAPRRDVASHLGEVLLLDAEARMGQPVGEVAVVGEQQQALGVDVEPADREDPRLGGHEVDDGAAAVGVAGRA